MLRHRLNRLAVGLLALLWSGIVSVRPALYACPMGTAHAPPTEHAAARERAMQRGSAHDAAIHLGADDARAPADTPAHNGHPCDCLGHCCAPVVTVLDAIAPTIGVVLSDILPVSQGAPLAFVGAWTDFVLPFATAPPALVTG